MGNYGHHCEGLEKLIVLIDVSMKTTQTISPGQLALPSGQDLSDLLLVRGRVRCFNPLASLPYLLLTRRLPVFTLPLLAIPENSNPTATTFNWSPIFFIGLLSIVVPWYFFRAHKWIYRANSAKCGHVLLSVNN
jgi:hypothetical protein